MINFIYNKIVVITSNYKKIYPHDILINYNKRYEEYSDAFIEDLENMQHDKYITLLRTIFLFCEHLSIPKNYRIVFDVQASKIFSKHMIRCLKKL
jgi:hypothetical protein